MPKFSDFYRVHSDKVIYDNTGSDLQADNTEDALKELEVKINEIGTTMSGIGSGGGLGTQPSIVVINPEADEVIGESYKTWQSADAYIQSQIPSSNDRWIIKIDGSNSENIIVREYITILGSENTTTLTGQLTSSITYTNGMDTTKARVIDCIVNNVAVSTPLEYIQFKNCYLMGGVPTQGFIQLFDGAIGGGNYTGLMIQQVFSSMVIGGVLHSAIEGINSEFYNGFTLSGGKFTNCLMMNQGTATYIGLNNFTFDRCKIEVDIDIDDKYLIINDCTFKNNPTFTVGSLGMISTYGLSDSFTIDGVLNNWQHFGNYYDQRESNVGITNTQDVLDFVLADKEVTSVIASNEGTLTIDMSIPTNKVTLTENITTLNFTNQASTNQLIKSTLHITQGASQNYTINFDYIKFSGGVSPNINIGTGLEFLIEFTIDSESGTYGYLLGDRMVSRSELISSREIITQNSITPSRDATTNVLDGNNATTDDINWNYDEHEYRFSSTRNLMDVSLIVTINQGEGWASDSNLDFYYIPKGETSVSNYIEFGTYNYPGMIDLTNYEITKQVTGDFVEADGVYVVFTGQNIEGGWATLNEFNAYATMVI